MVFLRDSLMVKKKKKQRLKEERGSRGKQGHAAEGLGKNRGELKAPDSDEESVVDLGQSHRPPRPSGRKVRRGVHSY